MKGLSIKNMEYLMSFVDSDFIVSNTAMDMNVCLGSVLHQIRRIERSLGYKVFKRGSMRFAGKHNSIYGLTQQGWEFYLSVKCFIASLDLIQKESDNDAQ